MAVAFDTLAYARRLRQAGVPEEQAQVHAEALAAVVTETLATKQDLRELEYRLTLRLGAMLTVSVASASNEKQYDGSPWTSASMDVRCPMACSESPLASSKRSPTTFSRWKMPASRIE